ncbi:BCCT family transporter [Endozoicomonas sp. SM1973]|uniref:BCCT family transporter n=1 Tax=Spartinivicinus marinus TaxID=2994442 RepID=A0A853ICJ8_9GAMM|nr:BCCT family transporter [Spartinivicinus marinus]MCX4026408.1 BCCT family transporter [Spartinivicinus marinus]NYZ67247.1 BCCT family transporter [Spartinivicinus marinus]
MTSILSVAIVVTLITSAFIIIRAGNVNCKGTIPSSLFAFMAILFTSGLDVGLIMFPLTEFPTYAKEEAYQFTNPLAIEFGFWGFLVWGFYFLTTFYFCVIEPKVKLFEIPLVKLVNNLVIIGTCAFTGYLFLSYLPSYIEGIPDWARFGLVAIVVAAAVFSSTDINYVKILSISSTWVFFALIAGVMFFAPGLGVKEMFGTMANIGGYFSNLDKFVSPISDYHQFYLFWWFSWSIMIGQFVARFVGGLKTWQLCIALLVIPSIPLAIWFSVLYYYHASAIEVVQIMKIAMVFVGVVFVINSLDSLIRLYTSNMGITVERFGKVRYMAGNFIVMYGLILAYQFTPFDIEWVGLLVIGLYAVIYFLLFRQRERLVEAVQPA